MPTSDQPNSTPVLAYKAFNADMTCRGHQYAEGQSYEHEGPVALCSSGYHACLAPIDVLRYYTPGTSVFHVVQLEGATTPEKGEDSKVAARKITIGAKVSLAGLIEAQVEYVTSRAKPNGAATASGWSGAATASGRSGAATASGESGAATASGEKSVALASGKDGRARGVIGTALFLVERDADWNIVGHTSLLVDGEVIKAETFYALRGGKVVEV